MIGDRKKDRVGEGMDQMERMILKQIHMSSKGDLYEQALECLKVLREVAVREDEGAQFNRFLGIVRDLRLRGHEDFFVLLQNEQLSLVTEHESKMSSKVSQQEAREVSFLLTSVLVGPGPQAGQEERSKEGRDRRGPSRRHRVNHYLAFNFHPFTFFSCTGCSSNSGTGFNKLSSRPYFLTILTSCFINTPFLSFEVLTTFSLPAAAPIWGSPAFYPPVDPCSWD